MQIFRSVMKIYFCYNSFRFEILSEGSMKHDLYFYKINYFKIVQNIYNALVQNKIM